MAEENKKIDSLIATGSEIAGSAIGGAVGFLAGGLGGAVVGGPIGVVIAKSANKVLSDISNRFLSKREEIRVGATAAFALEKIKLYLDTGKNPRNDGFFETSNKRSEADEVFEGVLLKSKNEHEEKKAKILGNIFANIAFTPGFSLGEANHLLQLAGSMTYRKMSILALFDRKDLEPRKYVLKEDSYRGLKGEILYETISVLQEIFEMYNLGFVYCTDKGRTGAEALLGWHDVAPNRMHLTPLGKRYFNIMGLNDIDEEEIIPLISLLT